MKTLLNLSWIVVCVTLVSCSRDGGTGQDGSGNDDGAGAGDSSAQGFDTPDAGLAAYGKALVDGNGAAFRKIAAKDTNAIKGLDAIIQFENGKSPEEAARINLKAMAPMQGFGAVPSKRFPAEITGDTAVIVQLFEREIALKKEVHFRKFKFTKSGGKWFLVGSEFGEASKLPDTYAWNKGAETTIATPSGRKAESFIPQDALAALIIHPKRAAASEIGRALLKLDVVQAGLQQSQMKPNDIERIIYAMGIPTEESENDCTIVQFAKPMSRETLLKEEFDDLPYEEVQFQGVTYYRYADGSAADQSDDLPAAANKRDAEIVAADTTTVLAKFPNDLQPNANGHADGSDSGNWFYYSSQTANPTLSNADLKKLRWHPQRKTYVSPRGRMGNDHPTVGNGLDPSPFAPHYAVLRWESRTSAEIHLRGNFKKFANATGSDGVKAVIFVDGEQKFSEGIKGVDTVGLDFNLSASVKLGSVVDFVVDPSGSAHRDFTYLTATIERSGGKVAAKPVLVDTRPKPATRKEETTMLSGTAIYFPDDKTIVSTDEQRLRSLISGPASQTPLTKKLSQLDLNHDLVAVVALEGCRDQLSGLLTALAEQSGSAELGGLSVLPQHAEFAVATLDLSGDTLLNVAVDAPNAQSASEVEGGFDLLLDALEGLRHVVPKESPLLGLVEQVMKGTTLQTNGSQVVLKTQMPAGLLGFVSKDAEAAIAGLAEMTAPGGDGTPSHDRDSPSEKDVPNKPNETVYREPPKDHPEFRDLAVGSHDCRVFFPGKPEFTEEVVKIDEGSVHVANFQGRTPRATYLFEIYTYPRAFVDKAGPKALLEQTRDNLVDAPRGRLLSSKSISYQDSPAIDFEYEHPDTTGAGKGHCRVVMRGNRVYLVEVDGFKVPPDEIAIFHDSLASYALSGSVLPDSDLTPIVEKPRLPVPEEAARDKVLQLVRELYENEFRTAKTPAEKNALAETMIARAGEVEAADERYVLLDVARRMAAGAGGVDSALNAVAQLDEFEVDMLQLTSETLVDLSKATLTTEDRLRVAQEMLSTARLAAENDRYEFAGGLLQGAAASARTARELKLAKTATDLLGETMQLKSRYDAIKPVLETLKSHPDDAAANQAVGEFYCLMKGQWETGLPYLAEGNEAKYKSPAEQDVSKPKTASEQMNLADQWFQLSGTAEGLTEKHLQLRAAYWYRRALPNLAGLEKETVERRLSEMKYVAETVGPKIVFLTEVPMLGAEGVLINDDKGHFREERLKGEKYPQVLWAHPQDKVPSHYAFTLNRKYTRLTGKAAINDVQGVDRAQKPQLFAIYGDKRLLWKSRPLQNKLDSDEFSVNVSNVGTLHLYVAGGGYGGHALWVDVALEEKQ